MGEEAGRLHHSLRDSTPRHPEGPIFDNFCDRLFYIHFLLADPKKVSENAVVYLYQICQTWTEISFWCWRYRRHNYFYSKVSFYHV